MGLRDLVSKLAEVGEELEEEGSEIEPIVALVNRQILRRATDDADKRRPGFHVSSMFYLCPRQWVLDLYFPENKAKARRDPNDHRIWNLGHQIHDLYQNWYLGPAGALEGVWRCKACLHETPVGFMPEECVNCGAPQHLLEYREPRVDYDFGLGHEDYKLTGNTDGILHLDHRPRPGVLEIKSIKPENFKTLEGPSPGYVGQVRLYQHLLELDWGAIVYVNKSTGEERIFEVEYDPGAWRHAEGKVGQVKRFIRRVEASGGKAEPRWLRETLGLCRSCESWTAQRCHQRVPCFQIQDARKGKRCSSASVVAAASLTRRGGRLTVVRGSS